MRISVSTLDMNVLYLKETLDKLYECGIRDIHLDVMDGNFVNSLSYGEKYIKNIVSEYKGKFESSAHFMVRDPIKEFPKYVNSDLDIFIFHFESLYYYEINKLINDLTCAKIQPGIVISPKTNIEQIYEYLPKLTHVMLMSVEPGKGGQRFLPKTLDKIRQLAKYRYQKNLNFKIIVDGGVTPELAKSLETEGVDICIVGSAIVKAPSIPEGVANFK